MTRVWVCLVRQEAFVGGESQRCRHTSTCGNCGGRPFLDKQPCPTCHGTGQVSGCGVMELIGGEPLDFCVEHEATRSFPGEDNCDAWIILIEQSSVGLKRCLFESQVRVGP